MGKPLIIFGFVTTFLTGFGACATLWSHCNYEPKKEAKTEVRQEAKGIDSKLETTAPYTDEKVVGSPSFVFATTNKEISKKYNYDLGSLGNGPAVAVGDFDGDLDLDIVVANGGKLTFYENKTPQKGLIDAIKR